MHGSHPFELMLDTKAQTSNEKYAEAAFSLVNGIADTIVPSFNPWAAVGHYKSWVSIATDMNAKAVAKLPLRLYMPEKMGTKRLAWGSRAVSRQQSKYLRSKSAPPILRRALAMQDDMVEVAEHPVIDVINRGSPLGDGYAFIKLVASWLQLNGWCTLQIVVGPDGRPSEILPMPPQWTRATINPNDARILTGWMFSASGRYSDAERFATDEVLYIKQPNVGASGRAEDLVYGSGYVERVYTTVLTNMEAHNTDYAVYRNRGRADGIIGIDGGDDNVIKRMQGEFRSHYSGSQNAGKMMFVNKPVAFTPLMIPPRDYAERDLILDEIAAAWGVPKPVLVGGDAILAQIEAGMRLWTSMAVADLARLIEVALTEQLLPQFDDMRDSGAFLAFDNPTPQDIANERDERIMHSNAGIITVNEARLDLGLEEVEDGDELRFNGTPLSALGMATSVFGDSLFGGKPKPKPEEDKTDKPESDDADEAKSLIFQLKGMLEATKAIAERIVSRGNKEADHGRDDTKLVDDVRGDSDPGPDHSGPDLAGGTDILGGTAEEPATGEATEGEEPPPNDTDGEGEADQGAAADAKRVDGCVTKCDECGDADHTHALPPSAYTLATTQTKAPAEDTEREEPDLIVLALIRGISLVIREQLMDAGQALKGQLTNDLSVLDRVPSLQNPATMAQVVIDPLLKIYEVGGRVAVEKVAPGGIPPAGINIGFDVVDQNVIEAAKNNAIQLAGQVNSHTLEAIKQEVARGIQEGLSAREMGARIQDVAPQISDQRATMIARTESARAFSAGQIETWKKMGEGVVGKQWVLAADACPFCEAAAAAYNDKTLALDEPFYRVGDTITAGGSTLTIGYKDILGPALHPNCRCDLRPVVHGEKNE